MSSYKIAKNFAADVRRSKFNAWMISLLIDFTAQNYLLFIAWLHYFLFFITIYDSKKA